MCPEVNGPIPTFIPDPEECAYFCECDDGIAYKHDCPGDLLFDDILNVCNWAYEVDCGSRPTTLTPSTQPPSTTPQPSTTDPSTTKMFTTPAVTTVDFATEATTEMVTTDLPTTEMFTTPAVTTVDFATEATTEMVTTDSSTTEMFTTPAVTTVDFATEATTEMVTTHGFTTETNTTEEHSTFGLSTTEDSSTITQTSENLTTERPTVGLLTTEPNDLSTSGQFTSEESTIADVTDAYVSTIHTSPDLPVTPTLGPSGNTLRPTEPNDLSTSGEFTTEGITQEESTIVEVTDAHMSTIYTSPDLPTSPTLTSNGNTLRPTVPSSSTPNPTMPSSSTSRPTTSSSSTSRPTTSSSSTSRPTTSSSSTSRPTTSSSSTLRPTAPPGVYDCPFPDGAIPIYFPNPVDCHSFYECDNGIAYLQYCPYDAFTGERLVFNPNLNVCVFEMDYPCTTH
ncbi:uncharacterized protein LOC143018256 [Oratosquilla oratoria]|uniref:uncharacterized protein LOC143018256 n=1 Tax=Oratosquilla oratoria TaxID=337810 RepID=UPI003F76FD4F